WWLGYDIELIVQEVANIVLTSSWQGNYDSYDILWRISNWIWDAAESAGRNINALAEQFSQLCHALIAAVDKELGDIEAQVSEVYNARMFRIYGQIATLSIALDAPPSYLEEAIQNAKMFALSVSSYLGLSWERFQLDWQAGLTDLLNRISSDMALYRKNPQWIKVQLTESLLEPLYQLKVKAARYREEQRGMLTDKFEVLAGDIEKNARGLLEAEERAGDLWELTIRPELKKIMDHFEGWEKYTYLPRIKLEDEVFALMHLN
ncbi:unnamed protein product, partial [marine sediment metagenome]